MFVLRGTDSRTIALMLVRMAAARKGQPTAKVVPLPRRPASSGHR